MIVEQMKSYLERAARSAKRPNAFVFYGPEGVGKEEAAYLFVQLLSQGDRDQKFIPTIKTGTHPDVIIVAPEIEKKEGKVREKDIVIAQVRDLKDRMKFFPYELKNKFCIIKKSQRLTAESANALLKILEEPATNAFFVLLADSIEQILPTIVSRCAVFRFPLLGNSEMRKWAEEKKLSSEDAEKLSYWSGGRVNLAEQYLENEQLLQEKENRKSDLRRMMTGEIFEKFNFAEDHSKDKIEMLTILADWERVLEKSLRELMGSVEANYARITRVVSLLKEIRIAANAIEGTNAGPRVVMERLMLEISWR